MGDADDGRPWFEQCAPCSFFSQFGLGMQAALGMVAASSLLGNVGHCSGCQRMHGNAT
jgi:hypothetical protein